MTVNELIHKLEVLRDLEKAGEKQIVISAQYADVDILSVEMTDYGPIIVIDADG